MDRKRRRGVEGACQVVGNDRYGGDGILLNILCVDSEDMSLDL